MFLRNSKYNRKKALFIFSFFAFVFLLSALTYNLKISSAAIDCCYHECSLTDPRYCVGNRVYECLSNCDADIYQDFCEVEDCSPGTCVNGVCQGGTVCSPTNQCSSSSGAPWYCDSSGSLVENCGICGCSGLWICGPSNTFCCDNQCNATCSPSGCTVAYDPDCGTAGCCGDGTCDSGEDSSSCPVDCGSSCVVDPDTPSVNNIPEIYGRHHAFYDLEVLGDNCNRLYFKFNPGVATAQISGIQLGTTPQSTEPHTVHMLIKKGCPPTIDDFNKTRNSGSSVYDSGLDQWFPPKLAGLENLWWRYSTGSAGEFVEIYDFEPTDTFYVMLYNIRIDSDGNIDSVQDPVNNQRLTYTLWNTTGVLCAVGDWDCRSNTIVACNTSGGTCTPECAATDVGCNGNIPWYCGEANDGDPCLDKINRSACVSPQTCDSNTGTCVGGSGGTVQGNINLIRTFSIGKSEDNNSVKLALAGNSNNNISDKENKIDNKGKVLGVEETKNKNINLFFQDKLTVDPDSSPENSFLTVKFTSELGCQDISQIKAQLKNKESGQVIKVYNKEYFALYNDGEHNDIIRNDNNWAAIIDTAKINLVQNKYQIDLLVVALSKEEKIFSTVFEIKNPVKLVKGEDYLEDQLIVKFSPNFFNMPFDLGEVDVGSEDFQKLIISDSVKKLIKDFKVIKIKRSLILSDNEKEGIEKGIKSLKEKYNIYLFTFDKSVDIDIAKQVFQQDENIIYADFNIKIHFSYVPSNRFYNENFNISTYVGCYNFQYQDPAYSGGVNRAIAGQWGFKKIGMEAAWDIFNNYSAVPRVLLVDADLTGSASGHATHMRGIITSYRSLSCSGASDPNETAGIINRNNVVDASITVLSSMYGTINSMYNYLITQGHYNNINVVNMSWGGSSFNQACDDILKEIYEKGIILIGAAGNTNDGFTINIDYPAVSDYVIAVSASTPEDEVAYFSQTRKWMGTGIEVAAPGTYIISDRYKNSNNYYGEDDPSPGSDGCLSWPTDCSIIFAGGNSMSSAMVSGVAGLIYSVGGFTSKTTQTSDRVRKIIKFTSDDIDNDNIALNGAVDSNAGYGRINADRALTFLEDGRIGIKSIVVLYKNPSDMNTLDQNCSDGACYVVSNAETGVYQFPANITNGAYKITSCIVDYENPNIDSIFSSLGFSNHNFFCITPQDITISGNTQRNIDFNIDNL